MRCKHQNGTLVELMVATHERSVENGIMEKEGYNEIGNITGYEYKCRGCKKIFSYPSGNRIKQKWLRKIHEQLFEE